MKKIYLVCLIALFAACTGTNNEQKALTAPEGQIPPMAGSATAAPAGVTVNPAHGQPGHDCALPVGAPLKQAAPSADTAKPVAAGQVALNPAHGQPGHDCALPVGAPLNSAAPTGQMPAPRNGG